MYFNRLGGTRKDLEWSVPLPRRTGGGIAGSSSRDDDSD
jgi:hypothetical protein